jgi:hypothetical protein
MTIDFDEVRTTILAVPYAFSRRVPRLTRNEISELESMLSDELNRLETSAVRHRALYNPARRNQLAGIVNAAIRKRHPHSAD